MLVPFRGYILIISIRVVSLFIFLIYLSDNPYVFTFFSPISIIEGKIKDIQDRNYNEGQTTLVYVDFNYNKHNMTIKDDVVFASFYGIRKGDYMKIIFIKKAPQKSYLFIWGNIIVKIIMSIFLPILLLYIIWTRSTLVRRYIN